MKCEACRAFYFLFATSNKFNNTGPQRLDTIYHMTLKLLKFALLACKCQDIAISYTTYNGCHYVTILNL